MSEIANKVQTIEKLPNADWWQITMENGFVFTYRAATQPFHVEEVILFEDEKE